MNGNIYINGVIGTFLDENGNVVEKGVELLDVILQVKNQPKADSFTVYINSPGGVVDTGYEIYDYLKALGKPIKTVGQGMVASIATIIFSAGSQRVLKSGTKPLFHLPSGEVAGNSDDIQIYADRIKAAETRVLKTYKEEFGLSEEEILPLLRKETILDEETAFKLGITTEKTMAIEPIAYFKPNPKPNNKMSNKNEKSILSKIKEILVGAQITNKIVFDAEGKELDFYELEDSATIELGAKANYDGQSANGEYLVPSEEDASIVLTYVFENGTLTEIKEPAQEVVVNEEMVALQSENEALKTQLAEKETQFTELTAEVTALKDSNKTYKKAIAAIKAIETEKDPVSMEKKKPTNEPAKKENAFAMGITNLTKNKQ